MCCWSLQNDWINEILLFHVHSAHNINHFKLEKHLWYIFYENITCQFLKTFATSMFLLRLFWWKKTWSCLVNWTKMCRMSFNTRVYIRCVLPRQNFWHTLYFQSHFDITTCNVFLVFFCIYLEKYNKLFCKTISRIGF